MSYATQKLAEEQLDRLFGGASLLIAAADNDKVVTSVAMKNGAYTVAAQPAAPAILSVTVTAVSTADTMGKITFVGTDILGAAQTEEVVPSASEVKYTTKMFASVTSVTGSGWTAKATADNVVVGVAGIIAPEGYHISMLRVLSNTVVAANTKVSGAITPSLSAAGTLTAGDYPVRYTAITLTSGAAIAYLTKD